MLRNSSEFWPIATDLILLYLPLLVISLIISFIFSALQILKFIRQPNSENANAIFNRVSFIFSFCVVGFVVGMIIRLLGGFSLGSGSEDGQPDSFQFIATLASSFAAIAGLFFGESKLQDSAVARPLGTGSAIFMMMFGYFYLSLVLGAVPIS